MDKSDRTLAMNDLETLPERWKAEWVKTHPTKRAAHHRFPFSPESAGEDKTDRAARASFAHGDQA